MPFNTDPCVPVDVALDALEVGNIAAKLILVRDTSPALVSDITQVDVSLTSHVVNGNTLVLQAFYELVSHVALLFLPSRQSFELVLVITQTSLGIVLLGLLEGTAYVVRHVRPVNVLLEVNVIFSAVPVRLSAAVWMIRDKVLAATVAEPAVAHCLVHNIPRCQPAGVVLALVLYMSVHDAVLLLDSPVSNLGLAPPGHITVVVVHTFFVEVVWV
mmetsp:Transcript_15347/g.31618  ORF Transcript_15347/g.31618 Transcript_15347/m.31618 type:complete len:215 (+) Transcript_15347:971-1615(+)